MDEDPALLAQLLESAEQLLVRVQQLMTGLKC
ncbi:hypothetical protein J2X84_000512 [Pseudomonas corrugata]|nr:hypothetical protein [Pseudomonas corrugata]